jgi:flagellar biosynthesis/type III secretory pathway protein FliH
VREIIEQSWVYQETIEKGLQQGLHQGLQTARQAAIGIVAARFPEIEQFAREIIETISDPNRLQTLIVELSIAPSQERAKELLLSFVSAS